MIKKLIKIILYLTFFFILIVSYLSIFGIKTDRFNSKIQNEISEINNKLGVELKSIQILLNLYDLSFELKTYRPVILFESHKLPLEEVKTNISIKSFINDKFLINNLNISTSEIKIRDLVMLTRSIKDSKELFLLDKIIKDGFLVSDINLNFDDNGKIIDNYKVNGYLKKGKLNIFKKYKIDDLNLLFKITNKSYFLEDIKTNFNKTKLLLPFINVKKRKNNFLIKGKILTNKNNIEILNFFFKDFVTNFNIADINFTSENNFSFDLNKKFKISNFNLESSINLKKLLYKPKIITLVEYLPNFNEFIELRNHKILISFKKNKLDINGNGIYLIEDKDDVIEYKISKKKNYFDFDTNLNLNKNNFLIDFLKFKKDENLNANLNFKGFYQKDKGVYFNSISFKDEKQNEFLINNLDLDNKIKINDIDLLKLNYTNINKIKNQISLTKNKKDYLIDGKSFDASNLINKLFKDNNNKGLSALFNKLNSTFKVNINKFYLDSEYFVNDFNGEFVVIDNEINKLNIISNFTNDRKLTVSINNTDNEKITTVFSDFATPFIKRFKFIKGFEEGSIDFSSSEKNNITSSQLKIYDFKLQELPALTKLLTLASLQGIADLLSGEGIRFSDFEMSYTNQNKLMTINEIYAIGPAISLLMDGYIEPDGLISLRGTLVPATTINKAIGSIPILGNILVGKKTGEGVFGVSFKIKGNPKDLKTTVNPIKTLTPRFITRTLEKIKKN